MNITLTPEQSMAFNTALQVMTEVLGNAQESAKAQPEPAPKPVYKRWRAEKGQSYYYLDTVGRVQEASAVHKDYDDIRYDMGNYFQTHEQAEAYHKHRLYTQQLHDAAKQAWLDAGMVIDWGDLEQEKHRADWDYDSDFLRIDYWQLMPYPQYTLLPHRGIMPNRIHHHTWR
jgi:hypothetical protein